VAPREPEGDPPARTGHPPGPSSVCRRTCAGRAPSSPPLRPPPSRIARRSRCRRQLARSPCSRPGLSVATAPPGLGCRDKPAPRSPCHPPAPTAGPGAPPPRLGLHQRRCVVGLDHARRSCGSASRVPSATRRAKRGPETARSVSSGLPVKQIPASPGFREEGILALAEVPAVAIVTPPRLPATAHRLNPDHRWRIAHDALGSQPVSDLAPPAPLTALTVPNETLQLS
jgi:hypothetical protein